MATPAVATTEAGYPPIGSAWAALAILFAAYTCSFIDRQLLSVLVEPVKADLGLSDTQLGLLQGISFALFYSTLGVPLGYLADRTNRRNLIIAGILVWTIATVMCGFARSFEGLFAARVFVGVGEAALAPAAYSLIADYFPPHVRGRALTLYTSGVYVGAGLGFVAGGQVAHWSGGITPVFIALGLPSSPWQVSFIIVGMAGLILPPLLLTLREPARRGKAIVGGGSDKPAGGIAFLAARWRFYLPFIAALAGLSIANYGFFSWTPAVLQREYGLSVAESGGAFGAALLVFGPIGMIIAGLLVDRTAAPARARIALLLSAGVNVAALPFALLVTLSPGPGPAMVGLVGIVFFLSLAVTLGPVVVQLTTPNELRGVAISIYMLALNIIGMGLGPSIPALIGDGLHIPLAQAVALVSVIALPLSAGCYLFTCRQLRHAESHG